MKSLSVVDKKCLLGFFEQAENEADNRQNKEDEENDFCYLSGASGDSRKPQNGGNNGDDEKYNGVIQHKDSF